MSRDIEDIYSLTPLQEGLLYHSVHSPHGGTYLQQLSCVFQGRLDIACFRRAWQWIVERHSALRTLFIWDGSKRPLQVVKRRVEVVLEDYDWSGEHPSLQRDKIAAFLRASRQRGFALDRAPLMRWSLIRTGPETYRFIWNYHHLLVDGWSLPIIFRELALAYVALKAGEVPVLEPARPYRDFVSWLRRQDKKAARDYWQKTLANSVGPARLRLEKKFTASPNHSELYREEEIVLDQTLSDRLMHFGREHHLSCSTIVQGAWAWLLGRYCQLSEVVFGSVLSGRQPQFSGVESMVGLFITTVPVRVSLEAAVPIASWLLCLQNGQLDRIRHGHLGLAEIQRCAGLGSSGSLFDSLFVFENYPHGIEPVATSDELRVFDVEIWERTHYDLTVTAVPGKRLTLRLAYDAGTYDPVDMTQLLVNLVNTLGAIISSPEQTLGQLHLPATTDVGSLPPVATASRPVHELIAVHAVKKGDRIAIWHDGDALTYAALNERANRLARYLQESGVGPEKLVALYLDRSVDAIVALVAVLKAGGAFVPLDPATPRARLVNQLAHAEPCVVLCRADNVVSLPATSARAVCVDEVPLTLSSDDLELPCPPWQLAYVIYTSGSTGEPKGAMIEHGALARFVDGAITEYGLTSDDRVLQFQPLTFDAALEEIFPTLAAGGTLVLRTRTMTDSLSTFVAEVKRWQLTVLNLTTAFWHTLAGGTEMRSFPSSLRLVVIGGEKVRADRLQAWWNEMGAWPVLLNTYGPTEATAVATSCVLERPRGGEVPIGRPWSHVSARVLDDNVRPVPPGVAGELYLGGSSLARGYLRAPELTRQRFVQVLIEGTQFRLYRTGDLVRRNVAGELVFLERLDRQVKVRGFRVELGEIETCLLTYPEVTDAAVVQQTDGRLRAFFVGTAEIEGLRSYVRQRLPTYMVPMHFERLCVLPLDRHGKLNLRALAKVEPTDDFGAAPSVAPRTALEERLAAIWCELLKIENVGVHDDFFALGGDSLLALQAVARIHGEVGFQAAPHSLFRASTIAELSMAIEEGKERPSPAVWLHGDQNSVDTRLFFVPGVGIDVAYLRHLGHYLTPSQGLIGIQAPGMTDGRAPATTLEDLASVSLHAVRSVQPCGPYWLAGHCIGGWVAFEMARQLHRTGVEVSGVALLDSLVPVEENQPLGAEWSNERWLETIANRLERAITGLNLGLRASVLQGLSEEDQLAYLVEKMRVAQVLPNEALIDHVRGLLEVLKKMSTMRYLPEKLESVPLTVFCASQVDSGDFSNYGVSLHATDATLGWQRLSALRVVSHWVPGDHYTMLSHYNVGALGQLLSTWLGTGR